jgi:hypothetical protein
LCGPRRPIRSHHLAPASTVVAASSRTTVLHRDEPLSAPLFHVIRSRNAARSPSFPPINRHCDVSPSYSKTTEFKTHSLSTVEFLRPTTSPPLHPYKREPHPLLWLPQLTLPSFSPLRDLSVVPSSSSPRPRVSSSPAQLNHSAAPCRPR